MRRALTASAMHADKYKEAVKKNKTNQGANNIYCMLSLL